MPLESNLNENQCGTCGGGERKCSACLRLAAGASDVARNAAGMCLGTDILGRTGLTPITDANFEQLGRRSSLLRASHHAIQLPYLVGENIDPRLIRGIFPPYSTDLNLALRSQSEVYLRSLREYINQRGGVLNEGWSVDFFYCQNRCETSAVYCSPDRKRFDTMVDVARHLEFKRRQSLQVESRNDVSAAHQSSIHAPQVRNKSLKLSRGNSSGENRNGGSTSSQDLFPLQFADLFILSLGVVDSRPSYHNINQIWPVGYKSCWHDKISGSVFVSEVLEGGDAGPIFRVRRYSCSGSPIPVGSTILSRQNLRPCKGKEKLSNKGSASNGVNIVTIDDDDEFLSIQMMLNEDAPPNLGEMEFGKESTSNTESEEVGDCIGEFSVESRSSILTWEMASRALIHACHVAYKQKGRLRFRCKHDVDREGAKNEIIKDRLSRFCSRSGPIDNIPQEIGNNTEFVAGGKLLIKWLQQDRFGLDMEFVLELLEKLPAVRACSGYTFLNKRDQNSGLLTVQSGLLLSKRKSDALNAQETDGFSLTCKRPRMQSEDSAAQMKSYPMGKPFSKLPTCLVGDVLQGWEFLWCFSELLGLEKLFSLEELENELIHPWVGTINPKASGNERRNWNITSCTGVALRKAHSSLLKAIGDGLVMRVAASVDPDSDDGESKSKRGKKKESESSSVNEIKFEMLQMNELTWPELARRFILVVLLLEGNLECAEISSSLASKISHCLQGDGGILCGSLTGVAGMEADALLLAQAQKSVFGPPKNNEIVSVDRPKPEAISMPTVIEIGDDGIPEWAKALEPVRKLPTNVGARLRKCVYQALELNPPEWARQMLLHSISKEVYKGNASGPTKRMVISLLAHVSGQGFQPKPVSKERSARVWTFSELLMKQCRIVLRRTAAEDHKKLFCYLLGKSYDSVEEGLLGSPGMVSRPLDFRVIDFRLAAGAYAGSHEAFHEDVCEMLNNIHSICADRSDIVKMVGKVWQKFEDMYEREVLLLAQKLPGNSNSHEAKKETDVQLLKLMERPIPKAPWEDGVCKVCGVDKDDDNVLLCDTCDSGYHTYCLSPPLAIIPDGNWYCPSCIARQRKKSGDPPCGAPVVALKKKNIRGELTRQFLDKLSQLARSLGSKEYWKLNVEERTFLFKFLCDETLNTRTLRDHVDHCANISTESVRKEFLGRDLAGRIYWGFGRPGTCSLLVDRSLENPSEEYLNIGGSAQLSTDANHGWISYQSDGEISEIVERLRSGEERELRESILQWQKCKTKGEKIPTSLILPENYTSASSEFRVTKAAAILEKKYGPCLGLAMGETSNRNEQKGNPSIEGKMYRCDCLELIWHSKHHCFLCHKTLPTNEELQRHYDGNCLNLADEESRKGKKNVTEPSTNKHPDKNYLGKVSKEKMKLSITEAKSQYPACPPGFTDLGKVSKEKIKVGITEGKSQYPDCPPGFTNLGYVSKIRNELIITEGESLFPACPPGFEDVSSEPVMERSLDELVKGLTTDIERDASSRNLSYAPLGYFDQTASRLVSQGKLQSGNKAKDSTNFPTSFHKDGGEGTSKAKPPNHKGERNDLQMRRHRGSARRNGRCEIPDLSSRQLSFRESAILRQLKINLLDMEAALPKEAMRPSMAYPERRNAWASFVKSAGTIFEMVQATLVLENTIQADYLRREWWYWSSPKAAASISTLSALALRLSTLDTAIIYEKPNLPRPSKGKEKASPSKRSNSPKRKGKANKRRREFGSW